MPSRPAADRRPVVSVRWTVVIVTLICLPMPAWVSGASPLPRAFGGRYPDLAVSNGQGECGIGAVVPWAGRLWFLTYAPHAPRGSDDKLYELDPGLKLRARPESVGGTPAARLIHRETNQLVIGPYLIDAEGRVRVVPPSRMPGRISAAARHLAAPADKVFLYDMEGLLYELDVRSLEPKLLFARAVPGWHGKGCYAGQGVLVVANNGEHAAHTVDAFKPFVYAIPNDRTTREDAGALAEWDGRTWRLVRRRQFTDVTGPGGIGGPRAADEPLWAVGWDHKSVLLLVRSFRDASAGREPWHVFRLPKACGSYDGEHGWHTEWPRIREVVPPTDGRAAKYLLTMHGGWYDLPESFSAEAPQGIRPLGASLKMTADVAPWRLDDRPVVVFGCDDTAKSGFLSESQDPRNDLTARSNSNLWFTTWEGLSEVGRPAGTGYVWREEPVRAGIPSDPMLLGGPGGYRDRIVHLAHAADEPVSFTIEIGTGTTWNPVGDVIVPPRGYAYRVLADDRAGDWIRVRADRDAAGVTAVFRFGPRGGARQEASLFAGLADVGSDAPYISTVMRSGAGASLPLDVLSHDVDGLGRAGPGTAWRVSVTAPPEPLAEDDPVASMLREKATPSAPVITFDAASVILREDGKEFRLPKPLDPVVAEAYERPFAVGWPRGLREVVTERSLLNAAGTFYVLPRVTSGGAAKMQPVCSHSKRITDFCSWRGLLVLGGVCQMPAGEPEADARVIGSSAGDASPRRGPAVWVGDIDELWKLPKPTGRGGPWLDTPVRADVPSTPYLMGGYDRKTVELAHDGESPATVTIEVDPAGDGIWHAWCALEVPRGGPRTHQFPDGFSAQWVRFRIDRACRATAQLTYR